MEGFLLKKPRNSTFGRKALHKRWFILEDHTLTYYEDFDLQNGLPVNLKGTVDVKGCEAVPVAHDDKTFEFMIKVQNENALYVQAADSRTQNMWIKALSVASRGKPVKVEIDYDACYQILKLDPANHHTSSEINRAYRKAALKSHPDKGGDLAEFKKLQEAFDNIMTKLEEDQAAQYIETIKFEAVVEKGGQGVGLGMVVVEDVTKGTIKIKDVLPGIIVKSLTAGAGGCIKREDALVKVGIDDVTNMPLSRVVQKLNDLRVPVGATIKLMFKRKIRKDGQPLEDELPTSQQQAHGMSPATSKNGSRANSPPGSRPNSPPTGEHKDDGGGFSSPDPYAAPKNRSGVASMGLSDEVSYKSGASGKTTSSINDHAQLAFFISENEELKKDLESALQQLQKATHDKEVLQRNYVQQAAQLAQSNRYAELLELQLEQSYVYATISSDQMVQSLKDMMHVSSMVQKKQPIPVPEDVTKYLDDNGLSSEETGGDMFKLCQRSAISATSAVDKSGMMVKKWDMAGHAATVKLARFEDSIRNFEATVYAEDGTEIEVAKFQPPPSTKNINNNGFSRSPAGSSKSPPSRLLTGRTLSTNNVNSGSTARSPPPTVSSPDAGTLTRSSSMNMKPPPRQQQSSSSSIMSPTQSQMPRSQTDTSRSNQQQPSQTMYRSQTSR